jgi:hypothetical protein
MKVIKLQSGASKGLTVWRENAEEDYLLSQSVFQYISKLERLS